MKTGIIITNNYNSNYSYEQYREDINYFANKIDLFCEIKNNNFSNIVEDEKKYISNKKDYNKITTIKATGYSQMDWQTYIIYHNDNIDGFKELLKRSFTHFNDYIAEKYEYIKKNGEIFKSNPYDYSSFSINYIEFPTEEDVKKEYLNLYGKDYNKITINID